MDDQLIAKTDGAMRALGMRIVEATAERVVLEWDVGPQHLQPMGIVHGGIYCTAVETVCSVGAGLHLSRSQPTLAVVGMENQTSFLRPVRAGRLQAVSAPLNCGRTTQLWQAEVTDDEGRLVASGRVRLMHIPRTVGRD